MNLNNVLSRNQGQQPSPETSSSKTALRLMEALHSEVHSIHPEDIEEYFLKLPDKISSETDPEEKQKYELLLKNKDKILSHIHKLNEDIVTYTERQKKGKGGSEDSEIDFNKVLEKIVEDMKKEKNQSKAIEAFLNNPAQLSILTLLVTSMPQLFSKFKLYKNKAFQETGPYARHLIEMRVQHFTNMIKENELNSVEDFDDIYVKLSEKVRIDDEGFLYNQEIMMNLSRVLDEIYNRKILGKTATSKLTKDEYELVSIYQEKTQAGLREFSFSDKEKSNEGFEQYDLFYKDIEAQTQEQLKKYPKEIQERIERNPVYGLKIFEEIVKNSHLHENTMYFRRYCIMRRLEENNIDEPQKKDLVYKFPDFKELFTMIGFPNEGENSPIIIPKKVIEILKNTKNLDIIFQKILSMDIISEISEKERKDIQGIFPNLNTTATLRDKKIMEELKERYKDSTRNLKKIDAIKFAINYIEIGGVKFARENLKAEPNGKDIVAGIGGEYPKEEIYFERDAAVREAQKQNKKLPSKKDIEKAANTCPGEYKELAFILGLKKSGFYYSGDKFVLGGEKGYIWLDSSCKETWYKYLVGFDDFDSWLGYIIYRKSLPVRPLWS